MSETENENQNQTTGPESEPAAEQPVSDSAPAEEVSEEPEGSPGEQADTAGEETSPEAAAAEPAAERPVRDSGPGEGVSGEPGGSPGDEAGAAAEPEAPAEQQPPEPPKSRKRLPRSQRHKHSKPKRERPAERKPLTRLPKPEATRGRRQERRGVVVSSTMDKTIVVKVDTIKSHPRYKKVVRRSLKFHAHDPENQANVGDVVRIVETRPLSKTKNWRLVEIVEAAK